MKKTKKLFLASILALVLFLLPVGCGSSQAKDNRVLIYTSDTEECIAFIQEELNKKFPQYEIVMEYYPTGNSAAKLQAEGKNTNCDIVLSLENGYLDLLKDNFADLSQFDASIYLKELVGAGNKYYPTMRSSGCIIIDKQMLSDRNLPIPQSYHDLLKPEYKGLISMPNPKSSSTGYMFLKSLVNAWGEDAAFAYFDQLSSNILQYTSSGSGPVNAVIRGEAAIGLGMTAQAFTQKRDAGATYDITYFQEGAPYAAYGFSIIEGKQNRQCVKDVFGYLHNTLIAQNSQKFFPEPIYQGKTFDVEGYPQNIPYSDMRGDTPEEKERLLAKWQY